MPPPARPRCPRQRGFTLVELLAAGLLTLFFFGGLSYAYLTVTHAALRRQRQWRLAAATQRALEALVYDLERATALDTLSVSGLRLRRGDGRRVSYEQRGEEVYRNGRRLGDAQVRIVALRLAGVWPAEDSLAGAKRVRPPAWLRVVVAGRAGKRTYRMQTAVRLYSLRPAIVHEAD